MSENNNPVSNEELIEYLKITYSILKEAKSIVDLVRLKEVIEVLKKDKGKKYSSNQAKAKFNIDSIINTLKKLRTGSDISIDEQNLLNNLIEQRIYLRLAVERRFSELYTYLLNNEREVTSTDLIIIYFWLTGQEIKTKKKDELLGSVSAFLSQSTYFDNMDDKYNIKWTNNRISSES